MDNNIKFRENRDLKKDNQIKICLNPQVLDNKQPNVIWARKNCGNKPCGG